MAFFGKRNLNKQESEDIYGIGDAQPEPFQTPGFVETPRGDNPAPSAPEAIPEDQQQENGDNSSWYPQLDKDKTVPPGTMGDPATINDDNTKNIANDDEKKSTEDEESEPYEMCEGITTIGNTNCIELQAEGDMISAKMCTSKCAPSFIPNNNDKELDVDEIAQKLNGSVGLFKCKKKRMAAFTDFILSTNKAQRQAVKNHYESKYKTTLQKTIER